MRLVMRNFTPSELKEKIEAGDNRLVLLDVREQWEFDIAHIKDAKLIPLGQLPHRLNELNPHETTAVICHHGIRSRTAGLLLEQNGFRDVINLAGGIDAWSKETDASVPCYV